MEEKEVLTVEEAATLLRVSHDTLYRSIREGRCPLPVIKFDRVLRIPAKPLYRLLNGEATTEQEGAA